MYNLFNWNIASIWAFGKYPVLFLSPQVSLWKGVDKIIATRSGSGLSSGVANHHFVILDSLLLDRTPTDTWPLGTHTYPSLPRNHVSIHSRQRSLLQFHCSPGTGWSNQGWWLSRLITKALSKGNRITRHSFCFPCFLWLAIPYKQENKCWSLWKG